MPRRQQDLTGVWFGNHLEVIAREPVRNAQGKLITMWRVRCHLNGPGCKGELVMRHDSLKKSVSCGCSQNIFMEQRKLPALQPHSDDVIRRVIAARKAGKLYDVRVFLKKQGNG